jgi:hypothetical protein
MRFRHFTQHGQGLFEVKNQLFTTSGFSAAGPQSAVRFYGEKIRQATNSTLKQFLLENLLRSR